MTASGWLQFCDRLREISAIIGDYGDGLADELQAIGYAHAAHLLQAALRWHLAAGDPDHPQFCQLNDTPEIADNLFAPIDPRRRYRLSGSIGSLFDINISLHEGWNFRGRPRVWGDLSRYDLVVDADGGFELLLGGPEADRDGLAMPADARMIHIREYYSGAEGEAPGCFRIECLDDVPAPQLPGTADMDAALEQACGWVSDYLRFHHDIFTRRRPIADNSVGLPTRQPAGNRNIAYAFGRFTLMEDEALILSFDSSDARLWSVQWLFDPWYENLEQGYRLTGLTSHGAEVGRDGRIGIILSGFDPGVANWLDTMAQPTGIFVLRWLWCEAPPAPSVEKVKRGDLPARLANDTPPFTAADRAAQLARRRAHFARRRR